MSAWVELHTATYEPNEKSLTRRAPHPGAYLDAKRIWREQRARLLNRPLPGRGFLPPPTPPQPPPATNWISIGPTVVRRGQATSSPPVSGRAVDIAIAPGGSPVYAATANGGVWRSDDSGSTWKSLMDNVDLHPDYVDADSQACGAVAVSPTNPSRVYVGTGEGESATFFYSSFGPLGVIYSYAGVGILRNDSGGSTPWINEPIAAGSPSLVGQAFYALAVDPTDAERAVGATTAGIYRREPDGSGGYQWRQTHAGKCTSVVVAASAGTTAWYAALSGGTLLQSSDGSTWTALGTGYPASVARVSLAVQPTNTSTIYAFSSAGVHRLDIGNGTWRPVTAIATVDGGDYCAAIAVDPVNVGLIFIGAYGGGSSGGASLFRGTVTSTGSGSTLAYSFTSTAPATFGGSVHPDVHRVVVRPDAGNELWVACDGGVFRTTDADGAAAFQSANVDLSTMTCTYLDQHPTEAAVIFCGAQDNGTLRYTGEEAWLHSADGDGGAVVVNWNNPYEVVRTYVYGTLDRTTDGGQSPGSWSDVSPGASGALFYPPLVGTPPDPSTPANANRIAMGADRPWFSDDFGSSWSAPDTAALNGTVSSLVFVNANRLYAGTTSGSIYLYSRSGSAWPAGSLIGQVGGSGVTGIAPIVACIVADPADSTGQSIYVAMGGDGDWRRVWHYDGTTWTARSGPSSGAITSLLNVNFNALVADPLNPTNLYSGADIGIWQSTDGGANWYPYADGLPESGISDLKLHATRRLLRTATYGRGVYERAIDATSAAGVELYVRDTSLDVARWPTIDGLPDPESGTSPPATVVHWESPNIKVDPPASNGTYQATKQINFFQFVDAIVDGSDGTATIDSSKGTAVNRVYVEVHNRGVTPADGVQVMLLLANASAGLLAAPLPSGYASNVQAGTAISNANWQTVGITTLNGLTLGVPQVAEFDLPSTLLPPPSSLPAQSHYCLLALLNHSLDLFSNTDTNADSLTIADRKVAQRNLQIVNFTGTLPPPNSPSSPLSDIPALIDLYAGGREADLVIDSSIKTGGVTLLLPGSLNIKNLSKSIIGGRIVKTERLDATVKGQIALVEQTLRDSRTSVVWARAAIEQLTTLLGGTAIHFSTSAMKDRVGVKGLALMKPTKALMLFEAPKRAVLGDRWQVAVRFMQKGGAVIGGSTYRCQVVPLPDDETQIQIHIRWMKSDQAHTRNLQVRLTARGRVLGGKKPPRADVAALCFTAKGMEQPPKKFVWDEGLRSFVAHFESAAGRPAIRRLALIARVGKIEGRKTVSVAPP
jgi:hypothetical protein